MKTAVGNARHAVGVAFFTVKLLGIPRAVRVAVHLELVLLEVDNSVFGDAVPGVKLEFGSGFLEHGCHGFIVGRSLLFAKI
jgi:hypothetical protein